MEYNVYCDESCHLEHDGNNIMVIGAVWVPKEKRKELCEDIRHIKAQNNISLSYELKWSKVSSAKKGAYFDILNKFFDDSNINFRSVIVTGKDQLDFSKYSGDYDDWYYKIYYTVIQHLLATDRYFNIYLDIKDTHSYEKTRKLSSYVKSRCYSYRGSGIGNFQTIRSEEVELMQMTDILIGALSYYHRGLYNAEGYSETKKELLDLIMRRSKSSLKDNSPYADKKFSILMWKPDYGK